MKYKFFNLDFKETEERYYFEWEDASLNLLIADSYDKKLCSKNEAEVRFMRFIIETLLNPQENG